jgi:hypothetical protein
MNLIALAGLLVLANEVSTGSDVAASISYTTVDRSGNVLSLNVSSNDPDYYPYYGSDYFYHDDRHYYRHYRPRTVVIHPRPTYVVYEPIVYYEPVIFYEKKKPKPKVVRTPIVVVHERDYYYDRDDRDYRDRRDYREPVVYQRPRTEIRVDIRNDDRKGPSKWKGDKGKGNKNRGKGRKS